MAFNPPSAEKLVDELATGLDSDLASHPDVLWYPNNDALNEMVFPGGIWAMDQFGNSDWYGTVAGWHGSGGPAIVAVPEYGMNCVRWGSPFSPDHYTCQTAPMTWSAACGNQETACNWRGYLNSNTKEFAGFAGLGSVPITEAYMRYMVMIEPDVEFGLTEVGLKLSGFERDAGAQSSKGYSIFWYSPPSGGQTEIFHYSDSSTFGEESGAPFASHPIVNLGEWIALEVYMKQNTDHDTADGEHRMWVNDTLVLERTGFKWHATVPPNGVVEINHVHAQIYHGGLNLAPSAEIHHRQMGFCVARRRIGAMRLI